MSWILQSLDGLACRHYGVAAGVLVADDADVSVVCPDCGDRLALTDAAHEMHCVVMSNWLRRPKGTAARRRSTRRQRLQAARKRVRMFARAAAFVRSNPGMTREDLHEKTGWCL